MTSLVTSTVTPIVSDTIKVPPLHIKFIEFMEDMGIYSMYDDEISRRSMRPISCPHTDEPHTVYVHICGTSMVYPLPWTSLMDYTFFQRLLDGSMLDTTIKTPDGNIMINIHCDHPTQFRYVYNYIMDGTLKYMSVRSSVWKHEAGPILLYILGITSPNGE